ncbi:MAG: globin family protein [Nitrospirota bacterium]
MTPEQIALVQSTFKQVIPIADDAAALFYRRLFELDPDLKALFKGDMVEQGKKLMQMIGVAVNGLTRLDEIVPAVQQLGKRHVGYGVTPAHYQTVGSALIWTLELGLGEAFTPPVKDAWVAAYGLLSGVMIEAAKTAEVPA